MDGRMGPLRVQHGWNSISGQQVYQIAWTNEQLQQIEQAIEEGDETFLATVEASIRQALAAALMPHTGRELHRPNG